MVMQVLFWILLILALIGALVPDAVSPYLGRGRWIIALILILLLGLAVFHSPLSTH